METKNNNKNNERIIRKVWLRKANKYSQKLVTIPSDSHISQGDYVEITKVRTTVRNKRGLKIATESSDEVASLVSKK